MNIKQRIYERTICPAGVIDGHNGWRHRFKIEINFSEDGRLSLCGDYRGSGGQILNELKDTSLIPSKGFTYSDITKILDIWKRWHLNDMRTGTPKQEEFIRHWCVTNKYEYSNACAALEEAGLLIDNGYRYGSSWLKEDVPEEVIKYLFSLPAIEGDSWSDIKPLDEKEFFQILTAF